MKRFLRSCLFFLFSFTLLSSSFYSFAASSEVEAGSPQKVLVGWYESDRFQEGDSTQNRKSGYSYEYLQNIANYAGWEYEYVPGGWAELYSALIKGDIDLLAGISYTKERAALINYPAYEMGVESYYIYKHADDYEISGIDLSTLNGKKVGTIKSNVMTRYFEDWIKETGITCKEVVFDDFESRDEAFANGSIDALIAVNNNVPSNSGFTPVVMVGESSYYLAVSKKKPELLAQLNNALAAQREYNPFLIQSLQGKYFNHTAVNSTLSPEEAAWVSSHTSLKVGYIDNFMPYCNSVSDGTVTGAITNILREWQKQLNLTDKINIEYKAYTHYPDLIVALQSGEVDIVFPLHDSIWSSEENGIAQTSNIVNSGLYLVYRDEYDEKNTKERIAITDCSTFQRNFVVMNYPESEIYVADTQEACLEAVKDKKANCTFLDSKHAESLLSKKKYQSLNYLVLDESVDFCIGVKKGNNDMYSLLSRGILLMDKTEASNAIYSYMDSALDYSLYDFILDHVFLVLLFEIILTVLIVAAWRAHRAAFVDSLTGFGSKRAYQNMTNRLELRIKEGDANFTVAVFDLNGLKSINDNQGHEFGDMALVDMSKLLKKVFGNAVLYRFGGDEFIAILKDYTKEKMNQLFTQLDLELDEFNRTTRPYEVPLAVAKGTATYNHETDTNYAQVFERADQEMYEDKRAYYEKHGDRRRK